MPTDYFLEELPDGGALQPTDLMHVQRNVSGTWTDYQIEHGNVRGDNVQVIDVTVTDAEFTANTFILSPFVAGKGFVIIDPPIAWVTVPAPTLASEAVLVSSGSGQDVQANFTNSETLTIVPLNSFNQDVLSGDLVLQRSAGLGTAAADIRIRVTFIVIDI